MADPRLTPGRIFIVPDTLDPQGGTPKNRRFVVISRAQDIAAGLDIVGVAISGDRPKKGDAALAVPWRRFPPHPETKLIKPSWAWCEWLTVIPQVEITEYLGGVYGKLLEDIRALAES